MLTLNSLLVFVFNVCELFLFYLRGVSFVRFTVLYCTALLERLSTHQLKIQKCFWLKLVEPTNRIKRASEQGFLGGLKVVKV